MRRQLHSDYYEAIIQLRPADLELVSFVERRIKEKDIFVAKKINLKTGVDYYVSSNRFARQLGKKLKKSFKGVLKESRKLYGLDKTTSKTLYRVTVCFRLEPEEE